MATHQMLRVSLSHAKTEDLYSRSFCRARAQLEGKLRGRPLDMAQLTIDLTPLPDSVRRSLLQSADAITRQQVAVSLAAAPVQRRC